MFYYNLMIQLIVILSLFILFGLHKIGLSGAYLSDDETSIVSMTAGTWDTITPAPTIIDAVSTASLTDTLTPTPEETVTPSPTLLNE